jgi:hypothetical protein
MKISQQFAHLKAASPSSGMNTDHHLPSSVVDDEMKQSEDIDVKGGENNRYCSSSKRGSLGSKNHVITKAERGSDRRDSRRVKQGSAVQDVVAELQKKQASNPAYGRASAIARLRDADVDYTASHDQGIRFKLVTDPEPDSQMKKEKRRKWKQKLRIAQEGQRLERIALDDKSVISDHFNGTGLISCVLDSVERTKFFKQFTQCGGLADTGGSDYEESEFESSTSGASVSEEDEDEYSAERQASSRGRQKGSRIRSRPSRDSSIEPSVETSVDSSVGKKRADHSGSRNGMGAKNNHFFKTAKGDTIVDKMVGVAPRPVATSSIRSESISADSRNGSDPEGFKVESKTIKGVAFSSSVTAHGTNPSRNFLPSTMTSNLFGPAPMNRSVARTFIEDLKYNGESMIWHEDTSAMNPSTVVIYLKVGYRCPDGSHGSPRLTWSHTKKDQNYSVDVFDIRSLERANILQLGNFPYAMPGRSICLTLTTGPTFIFEAATEEDAWNFVRGVRWMVARLAYNLVIGNLDVSSELLDLGLVENPSARSPRSAMEFDWSRSMDDVTDYLVGKTLSSTMI